MVNSSYTTQSLDYVTQKWEESVPLAKSWIDSFEPREPLNLIVAALLSTFLLSYILSGGARVKAPYAGYKGFWEPTYLLRIRYMWSGRRIIDEGYQKVSH